MGLLPLKYKFENIGKGGALTIFAALASNPSLAWLTSGILGQITMEVLKQFCMFIASTGLVIMNVGVNSVEILIEKNEFDGSFDDAFKAIHAQKDPLTPQQKAAIDAKVIDALRKFGRYGRVRDNQSSQP